MFEDERSLFVRVALEAGGVGSGRQSYLLEFETSMRVVAITALHCPFEHPMMEGAVKLRLRLVVTRHAELRFTRLQHPPRREVAGMRGKRAYWQYR